VAVSGGLIEPPGSGEPAASAGGAPAGSPGSRKDLSRRRAIALAAAAVAAPAAAVAACTPAGSDAGSSHSASRKPALRRSPASENSLPGDPNWAITHPGRPEAMMGYANVASVLAGQPITLYASTTARSFTVSAFRMGWYRGDLARLVWKSGTVPGHRQAAATVTPDTRTVEANWGPSLTIPTDGWPAGAYLLRMDSEAGAQRYVPVTIRSASVAGKTVIKNCVATWQAYNTWGGHNLYNGPGGASDYNNRSLAVSMDRPYDASGAYMFLWHERKFITLAERTGLPLAYVTTIDLDADPRLLTGASALFSLGHDEYWSPPERANVTAARDAGVNIGFLGANCCFRRTRLAATRLGERRLIICYKTSYLQDPMYGKDNALVTSDWREPPNQDPESSLIGTLYESNPVDAAYVVATPDAWMFRGTGVSKGTRMPGLVGIEYDRVNPGSPIKRPIQILSHSPLTCRGVNSYSDSAYYTHGSGAGVFASGTMRWVASMGGLRAFGLTPRVAAFTRDVSGNLLHGFADGPAALKYPAKDNLDAMQEWAGDPIAAQHNLWPPVVL
jgi:hypothetical protein